MKRVIGLVVALVATQLGISVSQGSVVLTAPVPNLKTGNLESTVVDAALNLHDPIYLIREQRLTLGSGLAVDGTPGSPMGGGGTIAAGMEVQSWILHFDMAGGAQVNATASGTWDFGCAILGLIFTETGLDSTDVLLGNPGTIYPTGVYYRDSNDSTGPADHWYLASPTTLVIAGLQNQGVGLDQIRVLTSTSRIEPHPEPASVVVWCTICACLGGSIWWRRRNGEVPRLPGNLRDLAGYGDLG